MERLAQALRTAIEMERRGCRDYLEAAERVRVPLIRSILIELAHDENEHEVMITRYYEALQKHQGWPAPEGEDHPMDLPERVKGMVDSIALQIGDATAYAAVYGQAMEMERLSRDFYHEQAEAADEPRLVEFFRFLERVEAAHLKSLELMAVPCGEAKPRID